MNKRKLKWQLATNPFDVYVHDPFNAVKRVHSPLAPSLSPFEQLPLCEGAGGCPLPLQQTPPSKGGRGVSGAGGVLHLRTCAEGLNKDGIVVAYLYSTHDGRFFDRSKDGWCEHKLAYGPGMQNHKGGSAYPVMRHFGDLLCHTLIAHAWIGKRPEGKVCDHLDTNPLNLCADNLEWVTPAENNRRARIAKRLRKAGIDPKLLHTRLLKGIYRLPDECIEQLIGLFLYLSHEEFGDDPLDKFTLNACLAAALDDVYEKLS